MSVRTSKFLSLVLRHEPARIGITLDDAGWTDVAALLAACAAHGVPLTRDELAEIVASSDKQRFALSADGTRIRANQGHSVQVELGLTPVEPPTSLYHGTVDAALSSIREHGLVKGARHHVHLSADVETATKVGTRRGKPVILIVQAEAMAAAGHTFYRSDNGVWLVDHVPPEFILEQKPARTENIKRGAKAELAKTTLEACESGRYTNAAGAVIEIGEALARAKAGTELYELGVGPALREPPVHPTTAIRVTQETTIAALARLDREPGGRIGCLNFASAKNPGGGFLGGAQAQEESLARSSGLYPCLLAQPSHYERNRVNDSALYLDLAIYAPEVPFFRDDDGTWMDRPVLASVITCAAPNAAALRNQGKLDAAELDAALRRRAEFVLALAAHHRIERLVLGAWGAGVFGNDPTQVAEAFRVALAGRYAHAFVEVVFAVMGRPSANHDAFSRVFG